MVDLLIYGAVVLGAIAFVKAIFALADLLGTLFEKYDGKGPFY
jgi:hypothetical protein